MSSTKELTVSCHCGSSTHTFAVPISSLPLPTHLCNCNISRRISGTLFTSYINITHDIDNTAPSKPDLSTLTPYRSSDILTRHFCSTCGTHMYLEYHHDGHFEAATGTLQLTSTDGIVEYKDSMWIEDTIDGGASQFIPRINGNEMKGYLRESQESPEVPYKSRNRYVPPATKPIHAHCHCDGVEFWISPPNKKSECARANYPDLIFPFHSTVPGGRFNPENGEKWWLSKKGRFLAGTCACNSCRRASGFDIMYWAFVPSCNITLDAEGRRPFSRNPYWGTMKSYRSSEKVTRTFCGTCGATVLWDGDERPDLLDIGVGLLDAASGARAAELLAWWSERVSFSEEGLNKELVWGLQNGLEKWGWDNIGNGTSDQRRGE